MEIAKKGTSHGISTQDLDRAPKPLREKVSEMGQQSTKRLRITA